jgi:hypothetical protein
MLVLEEVSTRTRRSKCGLKKLSRGTIKLTQKIHVLTRKATKIPCNQPWADYPGTNSASLFGTVTYDARSSIPKLNKKELKDFLGDRLVLSGGKAESSESSGEEDDEKEDAADSAGEEDDEKEEIAEETATAKRGDQVTYPVSYSALPTLVPLNLARGFGCNTMVDYTPNPLTQPHTTTGRMLECGMSYVAVCNTKRQMNHLKQSALADVKNMVMDPQSKLFQMRFALSKDDASQGADTAQTAQTAKTEAGQEKPKGRGKKRPVDDGEKSMDGEKSADKSEAQGSKPKAAATVTNKSPEAQGSKPKSGTAKEASEAQGSKLKAAAKKNTQKAKGSEDGAGVDLDSLLEQALSQM